MKSSVPGLACKTVMFLLAGPILWSAASADDDPVYESLPEVRIDRVFFSPAERQHLDQRRRHGPAAARENQSTPQQQHRSERAAAGYILNSTGRSRVYADGDFVPGEVRESMHFPGDISVSRQDRAGKERNAHTNTATEPSDEGD